MVSFSSTLLYISADLHIGDFNILNTLIQRSPSISDTHAMCHRHRDESTVSCTNKLPILHHNIIHICRLILPRRYPLNRNPSGMFPFNFRRVRWNTKPHSHCKLPTPTLIRHLSSSSPVQHLAKISTIHLKQS